MGSVAQDEKSEFELLPGQGEPEAPAAEEPAPEPEAPDLPAAAPEGRFARLLTFGFGSLGLLAGLSVLAAIPIAQFMTLGWLLEAEGRLARGESWRSCLPGLRKASRIGSSILGCLLLLLPVLLLQSFHRDSLLLAAGTPTPAALGQLKAIVAVVLTAHAALAIAHGGKLRFFFWPPGNLWWLVKKIARAEESSPSRARDAVVAWLGSLRLPHYLALGVRGFLAGVAWLAIPTTLLVLSKAFPPFALPGLLLLALVLPFVVVAQARVAAENDFRAAFDIAAIRQRMKRAPLALTIALIFVLGLALPLYGFKVEVLPRDALWLPALFFLMAALPGRLLSGWAHARGSREGQAHWSLRLLCFGLTVPAGGFYVFLVFFTQFFGWRGSAGLYGQHAFLLPIAFY